MLGAVNDDGTTANGSRLIDEIVGEETRTPCWVHTTANVLDSMPQSVRPGAKKAIQDIHNAEDRDHAEAAIATFARLYGAKFPKAKVTRGAGSRTAALAMVFTLVESAQRRWRAVNAPHLVALVRAGARFQRGSLVERPQEQAA